MRFLFIVVLIAGIIWFFNSGSGDEYSNYSSISSEGDCSTLEPENPYGSGSGHYAGFEWAERRGCGYCSGNSNSFIEGCDEYLAQLDSYESCLNN